MTSNKNHNDYDCAKIEDLAQRYLDGNLTEEESYLFEQHLEYCLPCDKKLEFEKKLKEIVRIKLQTVMPSDEIQSHLKGMLDDIQ